MTVLKSLADGQKPKEGAEPPLKKEEQQYVPDESDSTKSRRLVEDYDSTKNGMDEGKCPGGRAGSPGQRREAGRPRELDRDQVERADLLSVAAYDLTPFLGGVMAVSTRHVLMKSETRSSDLHQ